MLEKLLRLGKDTAIYGLSTVVGRLLNFILVPFYTHYLLPSEYGVVANLYAYIAFAAVIYGYGMEQAYMRFFKAAERSEETSIFNTALVSLAATSVLLSFVLHSVAGSVAVSIGMSQTDALLIRYAVWILCFDAIALVPFASLRMQHRPVAFASLKIVNIVLTIALNIVFILGMKMKVEGVLRANLIASVVTFVLVLLVSLRTVKLEFSISAFRELLKYGLPFIPSGFAGIAIQIIDRPIVKALTNDATLGVYQANYRLGIFMMLIVNMFDYAWRPFYLTHASDPDAKRIFSRVLTLFVSLMLFVFLLVTFFIDDLVQLRVFGKHIIHPDYWPGLSIVPWVLLAYVFNGAYLVLGAGVNLEKKTQYIPLVTGLGAIVNVIVNFWLIPHYNILGAALATLASYVVMAAGIYIVSQRFYPMTYEWRKVLPAFLVAIAVFAVFRFAHLEPLTLHATIYKLGMLACSVALMFVFRVVSATEVAALKSFLFKSPTHR